jgi:hypothetical protein
LVFDGADGAAGAGCATVVVFEGELDCDRVPNQFHCVKPKNCRTSTSSAKIAAAAPAPGPDVVDSASTTSETRGAPVAPDAVAAGTYERGEKHDDEHDEQ